MGFSWILIVLRALTGRGDIGYMFRYTKRLIRNNPLPTYLSVIILVMSFIIINLNTKLHVYAREENEVDGRSGQTVTMEDPVIVPPTLDTVPEKPFDPPPVKVVDTPVVPNLRKYAADRLNEISRRLDDEGE